MICTAPCRNLEASPPESLELGTGAGIEPSSPRSGVKNLARCEASGSIQSQHLALKGRKISRTFSAEIISSRNQKLRIWQGSSCDSVARNRLF